MNFILFLGVGKLIIWLAQTSGFTRWFWKLHPWLTELGECDLCVGVWVMSFLAWFGSVNFMAPHYFPVVSEFMTGALAAFGLHLMTLGWRTQYQVIEMS